MKSDFKLKYLIFLLFYMDSIEKNVNAFEYFTEKPSFVITCNSKAPDFNECFSKSMHQISLHVIVDGIPEVKELNKGNLYPFRINQIRYNPKKTEAFDITGLLTNITITGLDSIEQHNSIDLDTLEWKSNTNLNYTRFDGEYQIDGKILLLPIAGNGSFFFEIEGLVYETITQVKLYDRGNFTFFKLLDSSLNLSIKKFKTHFNNIYKGDPDLEKSINEVFNLFWPNIFQTQRPLISQIYGKFVKRLKNKMMDVIPANFFIEDIPSAKEYNDRKSIPTTTISDTTTLKETN